MYIEARTMRRKPQLDATVAGPCNHEGEPLDFSFLKLSDVKSLEKERPRGGKRIAIEKEDDEEEAKKEAAAANADEKADGDADKGSKVHAIGVLHESINRTVVPLLVRTPHLALLS